MRALCTAHIAYKMFGDIVYTHCPKGRRRGPCAPPPVIGNPSIHRCRGAGSAPPEPAGVDAGRRGRRPLQTTTENPPVPCRAGPMSVHRRASRLSAADASDSRGTSSKSPRFIRRRRRFGAFLVARSKNTTLSGGVFLCAPQHSTSCQPAADGHVFQPIAPYFA